MATVSKSAASSLQHQRGAAAVFAAISMIALLIAVGISFDLGRLYFEQRNLQRITNAAALDAARVAGGCLGIPADPDAAALLEVNQSVLRNNGNASYVSSGSVVVGRMLTDSLGVRSFDTGTAEESRAVQVILKKPAPARLIPLLGTNGLVGTLTATAAAQSRPQVSIGVGTTAANISNGLLNNLLSGLIGNSVNILSYQGLISQSVSVAQIAGASGQPVDQFLGTPTSLQQLLGDVLTALNGVNPTVASDLTLIRNATDPALMVTPGNVISVAHGYEDALGDANVSVGQLVMQSAQSARTGSSINVPLATSLPLIGSLNLNLNAINPGQLAIIPAGLLPSAGNPNSFASNTQAVVQLNTTLLPILGNAVSLKLFVQAAQATAELDDIHCARRGQPTHRVDVNARTSISRIGIGEFDDINLPNPTPKRTQILNVLGVKVYGYAYVDVGTGSNQTLTFNGPPFPTASQRIGVPPVSGLANAVAQLPNNLQITTEPPVVGALVNLVLQPVLALLTPAISAALNSIVSPVLSPVLDTLGLTLGAADVTVMDVTNDQPYLFINSR